MGDTAHPSIRRLEGDTWAGTCHGSCVRTRGQTGTQAQAAQAGLVLPPPPTHWVTVSKWPLPRVPLCTKRVNVYKGRKGERKAFRGKTKARPGKVTCGAKARKPYIQNSQSKKKDNSDGKGPKGTSRKFTKESSEIKELCPLISLKET